MVDHEKGMQMTETSEQPYEEPNATKPPASGGSDDPGREPNSQDYGHSARGNADDVVSNEAVGDEE
jgi:hypothetical protein